MFTVHLISSSLLVALCALASVRLSTASALNKVPPSSPSDEALATLSKLAGASLGKKKLLEPIDLLLEDIVPTWFQQAPNNQNGTRPELEAYAMQDVSNDDAFRLSSPELIARSGFKYELFDAIAADGYITQLTRLINPLADRKLLRQPPVLLEHGGTLDSTAYLLASSIQHFPEPWPRKHEDGPMRSWNRSLAFQLANNGFDVWLGDTRGCNENNKRHLTKSAAKSLLLHQVGQSTSALNQTVVGQVKELAAQAFNFWAFSQDDIIAHELKSHMDTVLRATGASKLNLMTFSLSTPTSLAFLGRNADYARKVNAFISMAPIISGSNGTSKFIELLFSTICPLAPVDELNPMRLSDMAFTQAFRELLVLIAHNKDVRYTLFKSITSIFMGPSPKWQTLLELNLIGHLFRQLSFREFKQMCQQMTSNRLQMYDYGPLKNQLVYKQAQPPLYDISQLEFGDWMLVGGSNDALSTPKVIEQLISSVNPKPSEVIVAPNFNHLDLFAGWGNDIHVNHPIMRYLERKSTIPGEKRSYARSIDLASLFPSALHPNKMIDQAQNVTKQFLPPNPLDPKELVENFRKSIKLFVESLTGNLGKMLTPKLPIPSKPGEASPSEPTRTVSSGQHESAPSGYSSGDKYQPSDRQSETKTPVEKFMGNLNLPTVGGAIPPLFDPKKMIGNFGQVFGRMGRSSSGPFGAILGGLTGSGEDNKKDYYGEEEKRPPTKAEEVSKEIDQVGDALVGIAGAMKAANSAAKALSPDAKPDKPSETLKNLADAAAGMEAVKDLATSSHVLG